MTSSSFYQYTSNDGATIPVQTVTGSGSITLDYSVARHVILTITGNTTLSFTGWPSSGNFARLTVEIHNTGSYSVTFSGVTKWSDGHSVPAVTQGVGAEDWFGFTTTTAGASVSGHWVGQNYT